jgi:hypothetical protein
MPRRLNPALDVHTGHVVKSRPVLKFISGRRLHHKFEEEEEGNKKKSRRKL